MINGISRKEIIRINKKMLEKDESHLWPIRNKFNVTKRAIRRLSRCEACVSTPGEYEAWLDNEISRIVNDSKNW